MRASFASSWRGEHPSCCGLGAFASSSPLLGPGAVTSMGRLNCAHPASAEFRVALLWTPEDCSVWSESLGKPRDWRSPGGNLQGRREEVAPALNYFNRARALQGASYVATLETEHAPAGVKTRDPWGRAASWRRRPFKGPPGAVRYTLGAPPGRGS